MMTYISVGLSVIGFLVATVAITFIIANGFFGDSKNKKER
jgi:hypothetical protein